MSARSPAVLVTDGEQRAALAIVRSLGRAGHRIVVCSARRRSLAGASRFCAAQAQVPDPLGSPAAFAEAVRALLDEHHAGVLLPVSEAALMALLPERERLGAVRLPFPPFDRFRRVCDKTEVARLARQVGIRVPAQLELGSPADAAGAPGALAFPLVLKPARSVVEAGPGRAKLGVTHVDTPAALALALARLPAAAFPVLLQERIVGDGVGIFVLLRGGEIAAAFAHRRLREKPPAGGVSVYRESIPLDLALLERSAALLRAFEWEGVAMVEYKVQATTGTPFIMEINGRFWGSLQLAIDAGVDFPLLLVDGARAPGGPGAPVAQPATAAPEPFPAYRAGVRSRWEWGDVDHLLARLLKSDEALALAPGAPGRARACVDFLTGFAGRPEVLQLSDPRPFLRESADWLRRR